MLIVKLLFDYDARDMKFVLYTLDGFDVVQNRFHDRNETWILGWPRWRKAEKQTRNYSDLLLSRRLRNLLELISKKRKWRHGVTARVVLHYARWKLNEGHARSGCLLSIQRSKITYTTEWTSQGDTIGEKSRISRHVRAR